MMFKKLVDVYEGERELGEVELTYGNGKDNQANAVVWKEIKISHYSQPSERCLPVAVLHTITANCGGGGGECFKMEAKFTQTPNSPLSVLHSTCLKDNKTAIMSLGDSELHLVAMRSKKFEGNFPCFWGFTVPIGLYDSCLIMLNLRCLGIVFDLDETLIVANTLRSFDDRIEALQRKVNTETDPQRVSGMLAEVKRYQEDRFILKQYADNDQVIDNGKVVKSQSEVVPAVYDTHQPIIRPLIRLQDKNIILTRINPQIRDTSVLVRLRPAWEDLRSYLTARGRKRFEVYVCTMAERDYALEMWRLLDPESNLINTKELLDRITCVKSGCKKSLFNVFHGKNCHPKMALVIDDRLKVWEESDQPRVHVVPAFAPYYAPQAEANNSVPVLCVARNVACNVRGGFFKDFDEGLLQRISEAAYEDDIKEIPSSPDVSNYLIQEDDPSALNGNKESIGFDGMADAEVERRLKEAISAAASSMALTVTNVDPRIAAALQYSCSTVQPTILQGGPVVAFPEVIIPEAKQIVPLETTTTTLHSSMEEGELPESEIDPDTRRRLLILQHGLDMRDLPPTEPKLPPVRPPPPPPQVQVERVGPTTHGWVVPLDEDTSPKQLPPSNRLPHPPFHSKVETERGFDNPRLPKEQHTRDDRLRLNQSLPTFQGEEASLARSSSGLQHGRVDQYFDSPGGALQDIAFKCGAKVEFKPALISSVELQFSMEVIFAGEKVGEGIGKTRRDAQRHASEGSLMNLADKYLSRMKPESGSVPGEWNRFHNQNDNGFLYEGNAFGYQRGLDPRVEASKKLMSGPVAALKELCNMEGLAMSFIIQPQPPINQGQRPEVFAQVEIDGQVLGKGAGFTTEDAKAQAAERAIGALKNMLGHFPQKRQVSPRSSWQGMSNKRQKAAEYNNTTRVLQRMPSSGRFQKNASPVP